ncbi:MAG TPA: cache domain-containing protein [Gammaproteobacteria bacterium]|jgi:polar amino acid transport system substrate-binding protein
MRKTLYIVASLLLLGLTANFAAAQTSDEVTALVKQTKADIEKNALQTLARVNRAEHPYKNKDNPSLYIFVFDTDLTVVAHAIKTKVIGKNVKGKPDIKGKKFRDEMLEKALKDGSGWVDYYFNNPKTKKEEHKISYFELAKGNDGKNYIVGSGKYFDE